MSKLVSQHQWKMCKRKKTFGTKGAASDYTVEKKMRMYPYRCHYCKWWHLTRLKPKP